MSGEGRREHSLLRSQCRPINHTGNGPFRLVGRFAGSTAADSSNQLSSPRGEEAEDRNEVRFLREFIDVGDSCDVRSLLAVERQDHGRLVLRLPLEAVVGQ